MIFAPTWPGWRARILAHRKVLTVGSFTAFLFAFSCLPTFVAKLIVVPALVLAAVLFALSPDRRSWWAEFSSGRDLQFIVFAMFWSVASDIHLESTLPQSFAQLSYILLIGCLALLVRLLTLQQLGRTFLGSLVGWTCIGILISIVAHLREGLGPQQRLNSFALNHSPIMAAGAYCCALFALLALFRSSPNIRRVDALLVGPAIVLITGLAWTQSRGPILVLPIALLCIPVVDRFRRHALVVFAASLAAYVVSSATILLERPLHLLICGEEISRICAPSRRLELWGWAITSIVRYPVFGVGFGHYFPGDRPHPHNGLLSLAFFAGIPFLLAFLALAAAVAWRLASRPREPLVRYAIPALIFGFGFMGTDLANATGFINTHYLFLWIPIFVANSADALSFAASTRASELVGVPEHKASSMEPEPALRRSPDAPSDRTRNDR